MSTSIDQAFIKQFEREVHEAYQRQGSKLRNTVRTINQVKGSSAVFQKVGKGTASTKSTHVYKRSEDKKILSNLSSYLPLPPEGQEIKSTAEPTKLHYND